MSLPRRIPILVTLLSALTTTSNAAELTFEGDIRPLLKEHCFHCHGESAELDGGLDLRLRRLLIQGGESGPAIVAGNAAESLLWQRIVSKEMPPDVSHRPGPEDIEKIKRWIDEGAPYENDEPESLPPGLHISAADLQHWSFKPITHPDLPIAPNSPELVHQVRNEVDRFLATRLSLAGLTFNEAATREQLIRRATTDLIGLPPSPAEIRAFVADSRPDAYERLVDRLLQSPRYGERWGRIWLDVAGYADSEGYSERDEVRPDAFRYRDYVIQSMNHGMPFDQFLREQIAGDEGLPSNSEELTNDEIRRLTASGFLRMAPDGTGYPNGNTLEARNMVVAKTLEIVSSSVLGLTVACAECHHHRYDPISHEDYYRLRAIFAPALNIHSWKTPKQRRHSLYTKADRQRSAEIEKAAKEIEAERTKKQAEFIAKTVESELAKLPEAIREQVQAARNTEAAQRTEEQKQLLKKHPSVNVTAGSLYLYDKQAADELQAIADRAKQLRATKPVEQFLRTLQVSPKAKVKSFVFLRGDPEQHGQAVTAQPLAVLTHRQSPDDFDRARANQPGLRTAYANWLTSPGHPTVARVIANRIWKQLMGQGIVSTPGDFGTQGAKPTHPKLLDWLSQYLISNQWDVKRLQRKILLSHAYRQSTGRSERGMAVDPDNQLYWRRSLKRIDAETFRDSLLTISGQLNNQMGGEPVPVMADRVGQWIIGKENLNAGRPGAVIDLGGQPFRRSVYIQVRRSRPLATLESFDAPRMEPNCTQRVVTTVPTQSLFLMNSDQVHQLANAFAKRLRTEAQQLDDQIRLAYLWCFAREPSEQELNLAKNYLRQQQTVFEDQGEKSPASQTAALHSFCHALVSTNEFLYVD